MLRPLLKTILLTALLVVFCPVGLTQENVTIDCHREKADIFFLVDGTGDQTFVRRQLLLIAGFVEDTDIGPTCIRVGVGVYFNTMIVHISVNNTMTKAKLERKVYRTPVSTFRKTGFVSEAIKTLLKKGLTPKVWRPDVPHIAVLITDEPLKYFQSTLDNAITAKKAGIYMITISVGGTIPSPHLARVSSEPDYDYVIKVDNLDKLAYNRTSLTSKLSRVIDNYVQDENATCAKDKLKDVLFLFDELAYGKAATQTIKLFLQDISRDLRINSRQVRVGVVSRTAYTGEIKLIQNLKRESFIESLNANNGPTIYRLLEHAWEKVFGEHNGARVSAGWKLVVFLQGELGSYTEIFKKFVRIKDYPVEIFIVYTDTNRNKWNIGNLATDKQHVMYLKVNRLQKKKQAFLKMFCKDHSTTKPQL